jgi:hypothetical protein
VNVIKENMTMNRLLIAVASLSLFAYGCAADGTEDPEPEPTVQEPQRDPPKQIKSGVFENPYDNIQVPLGSYQLPPDEPALQTPRLPSR